MILSLRINDEEVRMIDEILASDKCESENRSEWLRLLIHREWNKRKNLGVPLPSHYQTSFRVNGQTTLSFECLSKSFGRSSDLGLKISKRIKKPVRLDLVRASKKSTKETNGKNEGSSCIRPAR
jgi:hypothetical protein